MGKEKFIVAWQKTYINGKLVTFGREPVLLSDLKKAKRTKDGWKFQKEGITTEVTKPRT